MELRKIDIAYKAYQSANELPAIESELVQASREAAKRAYAAYSNFSVGAALLLDNGKIVEGNNQENAAYPSSICAERVAMFYASSLYPNCKVVSIAVTAFAKEFKLLKPVTPCGACRQVMSEYETKQESKIKVLMTGDGEEVWEIESVEALLPLLFSGSMLEGK